MKGICTLVTLLLLIHTVVQAAPRNSRPKSTKPKRPPASWGNLMNVVSEETLKQKLQGAEVGDVLMWSWSMESSQHQVVNRMVGQITAIPVRRGITEEWYLTLYHHQGMEDDDGEVIPSTTTLHNFPIFWEGVHEQLIRELYVYAGTAGQRMVAAYTNAGQPPIPEDDNVESGVQLPFPINPGAPSEPPAVLNAAPVGWSAVHGQTSASDQPPMAVTTDRQAQNDKKKRNRSGSPSRPNATQGPFSPKSGALDTPSARAAAFAQVAVHSNILGSQYKVQQWRDDLQRRVEALRREMANPPDFTVPEPVPQPRNPAAVGLNCSGEGCAFQCVTYSWRNPKMKEFRDALDSHITKAPTTDPHDGEETEVDKERKTANDNAIKLKFRVYEWLQRHGLCPTYERCTNKNCKSNSKPILQLPTTKTCVQRCSHHKCRKPHSIDNEVPGTICGLVSLILLLSKMNSKVSSHETHHKPETRRGWIRMLCEMACLFNATVCYTGEGQWQNLEWDEMYFGSRKYYRGHRTRENGTSIFSGGVQYVKKGNKRVVIDFVVQQVASKARQDIGGLLLHMSAPTADVQTDDAPMYREMPRNHQSLNHSIEFVRVKDDGEIITTNGIEGFWSLLRRLLRNWWGRQPPSDIGLALNFQLAAFCRCAHLRGNVRSALLQVLRWYLSILRTNPVFLKDVVAAAIEVFCLPECEKKKAVQQPDAAGAEVVAEGEEDNDVYEDENSDNDNDIVDSPSWIGNPCGARKNAALRAEGLEAQNEQLRKRVQELEQQVQSPTNSVSPSMEIVNKTDEDDDDEQHREIQPSSIATMRGTPLKLLAGQSSGGQIPAASVLRDRSGAANQSSTESSPLKVVTIASQCSVTTFHSSQAPSMLKDRANSNEKEGA